MPTAKASITLRNASTMMSRNRLSISLLRPYLRHDLRYRREIHVRAKAIELVSDNVPNSLTSPFLIRLVEPHPANHFRFSALGPHTPCSVVTCSVHQTGDGVGSLGYLPLDSGEYQQVSVLSLICSIGVRCDDEIHRHVNESRNP